MISAEIHGTDKRIFLDTYELKEHEATPTLLKQFNTKSKMTTYRRLKRLYSCGASHSEAVKSIGETERPKALPAMMSEYEKESIALEVLNLLGFADMDDTKGQDAKAIDKVIKDNPDKLARIYARRNNARLCAPPKKPPDTTRAHLGALNSILDAILGLKVGGADEARKTKNQIRKTQWPGQPLAWQSIPDETAKN